MSLIRAVPAALLAVALTLTPGLAGAEVPASEPLVPGLEVVDAPLVADAGNSVVVLAGEHAVLLGTAFGGAPPYDFAWSSDGGEVEAPSNPTAAIDTTDLAGGLYTAELTVTDADGTTATDTVVFRVGPPAGEVLLEETQVDATPGVLGASVAPLEFPFTVPPGMSRIEVSLWWTVPANDYDLEIIDPDGEVAQSSGNLPGSPESAGVADPAPGEWKVRAVRFATAPDPGVSTKVSGFADTEGILPEIDAGGPYRFEVGDPQPLQGTVEGREDVASSWDLDLDGVFDVEGAAVTPTLPPGRHLVSFKARTEEGFELREMTSVLVGTPEQIRRDGVPVTVIGIADTGINPYHAEFSAATYPDPEVLELTRNFTRHPSEYIPGYPESAKAAPITTGAGYFPSQDGYLWATSETTPDVFVGDFVKPGELYWIPGTKIIGAVDAGGSTGATSGDDPHPFLDDNGHGSGSASVSAGNRYGYCPTCLVVMTEALDESVAAKFDWIDISSNSFGYVGGVPIGYAVGPSEITKAATERGQTTLFAAGNGVGNTFFDAPILTYGSDQTGPDWNVVVGAVREDNQEAIVSDGIPVHVSNLGDGDLPSACRTGDTGQCAFGGTSAATPYTAGVFGTVLTEARRVLGDHSRPGQRDGQVVAKGVPVAGSPYLDDGELTRRELRAAVLKTAVPRFEDKQVTMQPGPWTYQGPEHVIAEGYGVAGPASAERALEVLTGAREMPARPNEDEFFREDCQLRDGQYEPYDRDGDPSERNPEDESADDDACADAHISYVDRFIGEGEATNDQPTADDYAPARSVIAQDAAADKAITYWLHRRPSYEPDIEPPANDPGEPEESCSENHNEMYMDRTNEPGDLEPCFDSRITSTVATFRPKGIFAAKDLVTDPIPAGSTVEVIAYLKTQEVTAVTLGGILKATDRELGRGSATQPGVNPATWTQFTFTFETERHVAAGEQLSFHFTVEGAQSYAYGYEGEDHASSVTILPAAQPDEGLEFGVTVDQPADGSTLPSGAFQATGRVAMPALGEDPQNAGFHPSVHHVQVSVDDPDFGDPIYAEVDRDAGAWIADVPAQGPGEHTLYVRAVRDRFATAPASVTLAASAPAQEVEPSTAPLPTTGGGAALVAITLMGLGAVALRRR